MHLIHFPLTEEIGNSFHGTIDLQVYDTYLFFFFKMYNENK